ncbi:MAG: hypothetical protein U0804_05950 [Gemmataceae bacterium]
MTSEELRALIEREIGDDWGRSNAHGVDLKRCLVTPVLTEFNDGGSPPIVSQLWLVLKERPEDGSGYKIVYCDQMKMFGLAVPGSPRPTAVSFYHGGFLEAFNAM